MKTQGRAVLLLAIFVGVIGLGWWLLQPRGKDNGLRHAAGGFAERFVQKLSTIGPDARLQDMALLPAAYRDRTAQEQNDFVRKALAGEISTEGLRILLEEGDFGTLTEIFPDKAEVWTRPHGILVDRCVAFRARRGDLQAELVLYQDGDDFWIVRCNNIRQLVRP